jgi:hypothetical protein
MRREDRDKDYEYVGLQRGQLYDIGNHLPLSLPEHNRCS